MNILKKTNNDILYTHLSENDQIKFKELYYFINQHSYQINLISLIKLFVIQGNNIESIKQLIENNENLNLPNDLSIDKLQNSIQDLIVTALDVDRTLTSEQCWKLLIQNSEDSEVVIQLLDDEQSIFPILNPLFEYLQQMNPVDQYYFRNLPDYIQNKIFEEVEQKIKQYPNNQTIDVLISFIQNQRLESSETT